MRRSERAFFSHNADRNFSPSIRLAHAGRLAMEPDTLFPRAEPPMYSSTFTYAKRQFDDEFHRLDEAIAVAAKSIPGYLGEEAWDNAATGLVSNVYYWDSLDALQALMHHPSHLEAKAAQDRWLDGYQVVIAQVLRVYGDGLQGHPAAGFKGASAGHPPASP